MSKQARGAFDVARTGQSSVVPDSGTGELVGLVGGMKIEIVEGKHSYSFEYELPAAE